jgi:hypothetical protein
LKNSIGIAADKFRQEIRQLPKEHTQGFHPEMKLPDLENIKECPMAAAVSIRKSIISGYSGQMSVFSLTIWLLMVFADG